jgi:hypothetical protein
VKNNQHHKKYEPLILYMMKVEQEIKNYINSLPEPKRSEMQDLHQHIIKLLPKSKLWFLDGKNSENKIVSNPNIGYGLQNMQSAKEITRQFYQIGISANQTGISVYILGLKDKKYLAEAYGESIGKASVTGYCIKFKKMKDINIEILLEAIQYGFENGK